MFLNSSSCAWVRSELMVASRCSGYSVLCSTVLSVVNQASNQISLEPGNDFDWYS